MGILLLILSFVLLVVPVGLQQRLHRSAIGGHKLGVLVVFLIAWGLEILFTALATGLAVEAFLTGPEAGLSGCLTGLAIYPAFGAAAAFGILPLVAVEEWLRRRREKVTLLDSD